MNNIIDQETWDTAEKKACVAIVIRRDGRLVLTVTRGKSDEIGVPGGKAEGDETPEETVQREVEEETGCTLVNPVPIFAAMDENGFYVVTFLSSIKGQVESSSEGRVAWSRAEDLIDPEIAPFCDYTLEMFEHVPKLFEYLF